MPDRVLLPRRGRLLAATPDLQDPNFDGTVILLLEHGQDGTVGVVLNRRSEMSVPLALGDGPGDGSAVWDDLVDDIGLMHVGGPVQPNAILALARVPQVLDETSWQPVVHDVGVIDVQAGDRIRQVGEIRSMRVFAGYSGWAAGQLEDEIASGAWFVVPSQADDPFAHEPSALWRTVLRRQGGLFTTVTLTPEAN